MSKKLENVKKLAVLKEKKTMNKPKKKDNKLFENIKSLLCQARTQVIQLVNTTMVATYFEIGRLIIEDEQYGKERAEYAKEILKNLSKQLSGEFGRGFSVTNLQQMRAFFLIYQKQQTVSVKSENIFKLSWSHYIILMRLDKKEREFYGDMAVKENWSVRELERQFNAALYERLVLSKDKKVVKKFSKKGLIVNTPDEVIKDPYILEFLGLEESHKYSETELEQAIIDNLQHFILELGKGFLFVGRQERITFDEQHFFIDLVFYHRILKCFVLIDLKIGKLKHQDLGQMQMYVNYYDREIKQEEETPTLGIIICREKSKSVVEYTLPKNNKQIFASKYQLYLPDKEELKRQIESA